MMYLEGLEYYLYINFDEKNNVISHTICLELASYFNESKLLRGIDENQFVNNTVANLKTHYKTVMPWEKKLKTK